MSGLPCPCPASPERTGSDLTIGPQGAAGISDALVLDLNKAGEYARAEKAPATRRAYKSDFAIFRAWAAAREASPIPAAPEIVAAFLASEAASGVQASTLGRRLAAIRYAHKLAGHPVPSDDERVRATMRGIRRSLGTATTKKTPATAERLIAMAATNTTTLADLRDRALLLLGFGGALRRSELVALNVEDIMMTQEGLRVTIRHSKTDQEAAGAVVAILRGSVACPVEALQAWLSVATIDSGPVFRPLRKDGQVRTRRLTDRSVSNIIKTHALRVGLNPAKYSGHSLRSGFVTSAARRGASLLKLMDVTRHKSVDTLRGYVRDAELFKDHAGTRTSYLMARPHRHTRSVGFILSS